MDKSRTHDTTFILAATIALLTVVVFIYWGVWEFSFLNIDDNEYVTDNSFVNTGLKSQNILWAFANYHSGHWHPVTWISHMIDIEIFGLHPGGPHLVNLGIHIFNATLIFLIFWKLTHCPIRSFVVSLFWAVNPLRLESVAWVSERKDVLSIFFALLTVAFYVGFVSRKSIALYILALVTFTLGLLSKPSLVPLPCLLLLLDFWPLDRFDLNIRRGGTILCEKIPFFFLSCASAIVAITAQSQAGGLKALGSLGERLSFVFVGYLVYLGKFLWPFNLSVFYPIPELPSGLAASAALLLTAVSVLAICFRRRLPHLFFGWFWFLIFLVPVSGVVPVGGQFVADRWTYFPHIGLAVAMTWSIPIRTGSLRAKMSLAFTILVIVALLSIESKSRVSDWSNSERLFRRALKTSPNNFFAETNLGEALDARGELNEATKHFEEAVRLNPSYPLALNNLGTAKARSGQVTEAIELFRRALAIDPSMLHARYHLGLAYELQKRHFDALNEWAEVLDRQPHFSRAVASTSLVLKRLASTSCSEMQASAATASSAKTLSERIDALRSRFPQFDPAALELIRCVGGHQLRKESL